jgi:nucleoporin GLE1
VHRLLNHLPANRIVATALDAFIKVAGYKLNLTFRGQFIKLMQYVGVNTLGDMDRQGDHEATAVHARLESYLLSKAFEVAPEGRTLPESDLSSLERA